MIRSKKTPQCIIFRLSNKFIQIKFKTGYELFIDTSKKQVIYLLPGSTEPYFCTMHEANVGQGELGQKYRHCIEALTQSSKKA